MDQSVASNLNPFSSPTKTKRAITESTNTAEKRSSKKKGTYMVRMQRSNGEFQVGLAAEKDTRAIG